MSTYRIPGPEGRSGPNRERSPTSADSTAKVTAPGLLAWKLGGTKISAITAYDWPTARIVEAAGIDVVLVGDSLGNTVLGYDSTLPVTMDDMLGAVRAVRRGLRRALLVADMPFGSYQANEDTAVENAVRCIKAGAEAIKLEGGAIHAGLVRRLTSRGIPVMGHIGLTPQSVHAMGGYRVQGRDADDARVLEDDADALQEAGCFSLVLEGIPVDLGRRISHRLEIPTIGIGAGPHCDGQILVLADVLGLTQGHRPRFVRQYADLFSVAVDALREYRRDVIDGEFPSPRESYGTRSAAASKTRPAPRGGPGGL